MYFMLIVNGYWRNMRKLCKQQKTMYLKHLFINYFSYSFDCDKFVDHFIGKKYQYRALHSSSSKRLYSWK